ncbi:MAG TPA: hypothetical protein VG245_06030 [Candidatus Dormibacteraeota bacterium]|nr:hypothetical protein [Candidatus Dormibacteraeota bacterium]
MEVELAGWDPSKEAVDDILDALAGHAPSISAGDGRASVRVSVRGRTALAAATTAVGLVAAHTPAEADAVGLVVETVDDLEQRLSRSNAPDLVGVAELATLLGVSRQRVSQLGDSNAFPRPVAQLAAGPVWLRQHVGRFVETWNRQPGRPRKAALGTGAQPGSRKAAAG